MIQACVKLLAALEGEDAAVFLECIQRHASRDGVDLAETLQALPKKEYPRLGTALLAKVTAALQELAQAAETEEGVRPAKDNTAVEGTTGVLSGAALVVTLLASELGGGASARHCPETLVEAATALHDGALLAAQDHPSLQEAVSKMCEAWWARDLPGKEGMVAQALPYLLVRALATGKMADVKRVYSLRQALPMFDFDDESIASLKRLLLRCAFAPPFLRAADGRRFVSSLFHLHPQMARELVAIVRNQIPSGRRSVLDAYGDILYRAWRTASGPAIYELEYNCVQPLMESAIMASTPAMAAALRRVLDGFHTQKRQRGVDEMLLRLYEPILFRSLSVANPAVRRNAAQVLVGAFPLQDPASSAEEADALLQRQFRILTGLLKDDAPAVRAAAVEGVCDLLNVYWELVPAATCTNFLAQLVDDLSRDAASAGVRHAAIVGIAGLVDNPLAQPALKAALPRLASSLTDSSPRVRAAMADLLLAVRHVRAIKFFEVVPVEKLLASLSTDVPPVASKVAKLLLPSYLPLAEGIEEAAGRLLLLLVQSPEAGSALCRHAAAAGAPAEGCWELVALLRDHLIAGAPRASAAAPPPPPPRSARGGGKRKGRAPPTPVATPDDDDAEEIEPALWEATAAALQELCGALISAGAAAPKGVLQGALLSDLLSAGPTASARAAVLRMASSLPPDRAPPALLRKCRARLAEGGGGAVMTPEDDAALACACAWGGAAELAQQIEEALAIMPTADDPKEGGEDSGSGSPSPPSAKRARGEGAPMDAAGGARAMLALMAGEGTRRAMEAGGHLAALLPRLAAASSTALSLRATPPPAAAALALACGKCALHLLAPAPSTPAAPGAASFVTPHPSGSRGEGTEDEAMAALGALLASAQEVVATWEEAGAGAPAVPAPAPAKKGKGAGRRGKKGAVPPTPAGPACDPSPLPIVEAALALAAEAGALGLLCGPDSAAARSAAVDLASAAAAKLPRLRADAAAAAAGHAARLARHLAAGGAGGTHPAPADGDRVLAAVLAAASRSEEACGAVRPHAAACLPKLVHAARSAWVAPVADALAKDDGEDEFGVTTSPMPRMVLACLRAPRDRGAAAALAARAARPAAAAGDATRAAGAVELARHLARGPRGGSGALPREAEGALRGLLESQRAAAASATCREEQEGGDGGASMAPVVEALQRALA